MKAMYLIIQKAGKLAGLLSLLCLLILSNTTNLQAEDTFELGMILPVLEEPPTLFLNACLLYTSDAADE